MPDFPRPLSENGSDLHPDSVTRYSIRRKGSVYNIIGPEGRVFAKYKSASIVGPRWEELTETPWPYPSSAYEPGTRLWQLGLIDRSEVGKIDQSPTPAKSKRTRVSLDTAPEPRTASQENEKARKSPTAKARPALKPLKTPARQLTLMDQPADATIQPATKSVEVKPAEQPAQPPPPAQKPEAPALPESASSTIASPVSPTPAANAAGTRQETKPTRRKSAPKTPAAPVPAKKKTRAATTTRTTVPSTSVVESPVPLSIVFPALTTLALPIPRINLEEQTRHIQTLRRNPQLLFEPQMRVILQREVEYHRPFARWAQTLLTMLARYDKRRQRVRAAPDPQTILAKHIAWQEEQLRGASTSR